MVTAACCSPVRPSGAIVLAAASLHDFAPVDQRDTAAGTAGAEGHAIESLLLELDDVVEAAVVGIPDDVLGEAVRAFVVPRSDEHRDLVAGVRAFCKRRMTRHLVPREILVVTSIPKNSSGKVMKNQLREMQISDRSVDQNG